MFKKQEVSVVGWILLLVILNVPVLNIIFVVWAFLSNKVNRTLKNFFSAYLVFWLLSFFGIFSVTFDNFQSLFG